ncbi:MAG: type I-E CRISPR-associated protein Cas5/CasD [Leptospiraceae bacterium]|nr:type I-E CRISPR-associated protein Cas5/CasD [Leptospiraceae bacterium]
MKEFLLFQLYGPFASWGDIAVGENRHSFSHPSKSAIIGILASALGIKREEEETLLELNDSLSFSTQVFSTGILLRDFHTVQTPPAPKKKVSYYSRKDELENPEIGTIITNRDYRCDSYSIVCVWQKENKKFDLDNLKMSLLNPKYILYLGRKSCVVSLPLNPKLVKSETLLDAYSAYPQNAELLSSLEASKNIQMYWEDLEEVNLQPDHIQTRRDSILRRKSWYFTERIEFYKMIQMGDK